MRVNGGLQTLSQKARMALKILLIPNPTGLWKCALEVCAQSRAKRVPAHPAPVQAHNCLGTAAGGGSDRSQDRTVVGAQIILHDAPRRHQRVKAG